MSKTTTEEHEMTKDWYTIVEAGSYADTPPAPRGPWHGRGRAEDALSRFCARLGSEAGSHIAACSTRVVGPFATRAIALDADISNYPLALMNGTFGEPSVEEPIDFSTGLAAYPSDGALIEEPDWHFA